MCCESVFFYVFFFSFICLIMEGGNAINNIIVTSIIQGRAGSG